MPIAPLDVDQVPLLRTFGLSYNSLEYYREQGIEYLVAGSGMRERFATEADRCQSNVEFYERLEREATLVFWVTPSLWGRSGPTVCVYRVAVAG